MNDKNIILTGFMGVGKSTVGRLLAAATGWQFVDTDDEITTRAGKSVPDIFADEGEDAFRDLEAEAAAALSRSSGLVIATGGGFMLNPANRTALQATGTIFCLTARPETILQRVGDGANDRPLLTTPDPTGAIRDLLARRAPIYSQFYQIATDDQPPAAVVAAITAILAAGRKLPVHHPGGSYDVVIGRALLPRVRRLANIEEPLVVITDENVGPLYAGQIGADKVLTIPAGERHKNLATVRHLYDALLAASIDRGATIVSLGGGVVSDVAGFVAATYLRGLRFIPCPTSLLAMVDATVGGKTGVDMPQGKNLIGAFKQPELVLADLDTLATLPPAEFAAGMAEVIKSGLLAAPALLAGLKNSRFGPEGIHPYADLESLLNLVTDTVKIKRDIVEADPFEQGRRAILNLGHTFGHAIEKVSGYAVGHGPAVAIGLVAAAQLSTRLGYARADLAADVAELVTAHGLPQALPAGLDPIALFAAMGSDKKRSRGRLRFILMREVADIFITDEVPKADIIAVLAELSPANG